MCDRRDTEGYYCKITGDAGTGFCALRPVVTPPTPGSLRVDWTVDGAVAATGCAAAAVDTVAISFTDDLATLSVPCSDGHAVVPVVGLGNHTVVVTPMRSDGHCFADLGGTCSAASHAVLINSGVQSTASVALVVSGGVSVTWTVDGLTPDSRICSTLNAATVHLELRSGITGPPLTLDVPCVNGEGAFSNVPTFNTYTVHADIVRPDGSIPQSLDSGSFFLNPGQDLVVPIFVFDFDEGSIGKLHVTWTVNGVAPTPTSPGPCTALDAEHVAMSYPADNQEPRCDAGEATFSAVVPGDSVLVALLENGNNAALASISAPFHVAPHATTELALAFVTTSNACDPLPCTLVLSGAVNQTLSCIRGNGNYDSTSNQTTRFGISQHTVTGVVAAVSSSLPFLGMPRVGPATLLGAPPAPFPAYVQLETTANVFFEATLGPPAVGSMAFNITAAAPRIGGTPGDWCLHGTLDAVLPGGPTSSVTLHADF